MFAILLLSACTTHEPKSDTGGADMSADTASDTGSDDTAPCVLTSADPSAVTVVVGDVEGVNVTLYGCAAEVRAVCPEWVYLTAPSSVDGEATVNLAPMAGWSGDRDGECVINEVTLTVAFRM